MASLKYSNGSSWQSPAYFGKTRMWDGSQWRTIELNVATSAGTSGFISFSPSSGDLSAATYDGASTAYITITASNSVAWTWSQNQSYGTASVSSGASASSITFSLTNDYYERDVTFTVSAGGSSWTVYLYTVGSSFFS